MKKIALFCGALIASVMTLNAEVVYNGEAHNVRSWNAKQLPVADYSVLATAKAGDALVINVTAVEDGARITLQSKDWHGWTDKYDVTVGRHVFVLTKATADSVRNGLIVTGEKYTFDKVELLYPQNLWTGTLSDNAGWAQSDELSKDLFTTIEEGSIVGVVVSAINNGETWHQFSIRGREDDDANWERLETILSKSVSETGTYPFVLTADQATSFRDKNIGLTAQYLDITALTTYVDTRSDGPATAIDELQSDEAQSTKIFRNGQLYIMYKGTMYDVRGNVVK